MLFFVSTLTVNISLPSDSVVGGEADHLVSIETPVLSTQVLQSSQLIGQCSYIWFIEWKAYFNLLAYYKNLSHESHSK